jgi:ABC-2 type transport system ATP-binding protein
MIRIEQLNKTFGRVQAVQSLDLAIPRGQLFCFLGANGAGKTTTIKMLCGLLRPTSGRIKIGDYDLTQDPRAARHITGYIPDQPYLYDRLTATEFFQFTGDLYGIPRPDVEHEMEASFELFGLLDYRDSLIKDLSHGLRQRLIYTATLLHNPEVIFVDEPFVGLDPYSIRLIKELLKRKTREEGMTIFLTTHILALAEDMADRIGIIDKGRLIADGTLEELSEKSSIQGRLEDVFLKLTE